MALRCGWRVSSVRRTRRHDQRRRACALPELTTFPGEPLPPVPDCAYPPGAVDLPEEQR